VHVRLYGGDLRCEWGQFDSWNKWVVAYPGSRVFVGMVASPEVDKDAVADLPIGRDRAAALPNLGSKPLIPLYFPPKIEDLASLFLF
jgi:chitinase